MCASKWEEHLVFLKTEAKPYYSEKICKSMSFLGKNQDARRSKATNFSNFVSQCSTRFEFEFRLLGRKSDCHTIFQQALMHLSLERTSTADSQKNSVLPEMSTHSHCHEHELLGEAHDAHDFVGDEGVTMRGTAYFCSYIETHSKSSVRLLSGLIVSSDLESAVSVAGVDVTAITPRNCCIGPDSIVFLLKLTESRVCAFFRPGSRYYVSEIISNAIFYRTVT